MLITNDETAINILKLIAQDQLQPAADPLPPLAQVSEVLSTAFEPSLKLAFSDGEVARAALNLLAQDIHFADAIRQMTVVPAVPTRREKYSDASTIALTTAIVLVLQTRIKFKVNSRHQWSIEFDKCAVGGELVAPLVQRLLALLDRLNGK